MTSGPVRGVAGLESSPKTPPLQAGAKRTEPITTLAVNMLDVVALGQHPEPPLQAW
jgi:hypothetical protein